MDFKGPNLNMSYQKYRNLNINLTLSNTLLCLTTFQRSAVIGNEKVDYLSRKGSHKKQKLTDRWRNSLASRYSSVYPGYDANKINLLTRKII